MWPFTKKYSLEDSGIMQGFVDWHSHVLPGVDDGIKKIEDSLKVIKEYERMGVDTLWLTPHIMEDMPNHPDDLRRVYDDLMARYDGPLKIRLGAENMLDNLFDDRLAAKALLPIGDKGQHLLVETSYFTPPSDFENKLSRTFAAGYFPLLAHPERYVYMDIEQYDELHEKGIKMQLNLSSLFGFYGKDAKRKAEYMLENGYYYAIGSDTHRFSQVKISQERGEFTKKMLNLIKAIPGIE